MSLRSEALLDHIANFLKFISSTQSFWFSLDTSYNHGCHPASRFRLDPDEYEALLIVAGLASYTRFGFQIKASAWRKFLGGRRFVIDNCAIEFEQKKIDLDAYINGTPPSRLQRRKLYVVRIGNKSEQSHNKIEEQIGRDGRLIAPPPRMNLLRITQQSFRIIVDQYLWQYTIDNDDGDENKDIGTASSRPQPDCTSGSPPAASADEVANTPPANKKRKLNEVLSLTDAMPDDNDVRQLYPHLCRALGLDDGFDPTDSSVRKSTVALLTEINHLLSTKYELVVRGYGNKNINYVRVPQTCSDDSL
jgi:hypothetical protein